MQTNRNLAIRPITATIQENAALLEMWNASADYDPLTPDLWQEFVYQDPDFVPQHALAVFAGTQPVAFAMGVVRSSGIGYIKMMLVSKTYRKQNVGKMLLLRMETALSDLGAHTIRVGEAPPAYFIPGIDPRYTSTIAFFQKNGYEKFNEGYHMHCNLLADDWDTSEAEARLLSRGLEVRRANLQDFEPLMAFLAQYFSAWQFEVAASFRKNPVAIHLGLRNGQLLGFAAYDGTHVGLPWFGPMGTDPTERKLGIGAVLLRRCLRDQKADGHTFSVIPWVGPYTFYAQHAGAEISRVFWRFQKTISPVS